MSAIEGRRKKELDRIITAFEATPRQLIPVARILRFAVATAMRQDEITRIMWEDFDPIKKMLVIRDRKDPRRKVGNHQRIPLLDVSGYDTCAIIEEQRAVGGAATGRIFPYNGKSVGTAFRRECADYAFTICTFMICGTKARAAFLKPVSRSSRSRWSPATEIGRCCAVTHT